MDERHKRVRERAYDIWVEAGQPHGQSDAHWAQAEQEVAAATPAKGRVPRSEPAKAASARQASSGKGASASTGAKAKDAGTAPQPSSSPTRSAAKKASTPSLAGGSETVGKGAAKAKAKPAATGEAKPRSGKKSSSRTDVPAHG